MNLNSKAKEAIRNALTAPHPTEAQFKLKRIAEDMIITALRGESPAGDNINRIDYDRLVAAVSKL